MQVAHETAGLVPPKRRLSDDEMLTILDDVWTITGKESGRSPVYEDLKRYAVPVSRNAIILRFGTWKKALLLAAAWAPGRPKVGETSAGDTARARPVSDRKRFLIFKRDKYRCRMCRRAGGDLEVDHVVPVCRGGKNNLDNLQTLCKRCNRGKRGDLQ